MLLPNATNTLLWTAFSRITNPALNTTIFNDWYNTQLLPGFMQHTNASLGLRYNVLFKPNTGPGNMSDFDYVAVYKTPAQTQTQSYDKAQWRKESMMWPQGTSEIGPNDVAIELQAWRPIQTFESLREKRGGVPAGRAKAVVIVRLEPRAGLEGEKEVEEWYRYQHLDMISMLPNYRRSTRYRSVDDATPRWLGIHEMDTPDMDPYQADVLMGTELAQRVMAQVRVFEASIGTLIFESGSEKL